MKRTPTISPTCSRRWRSIRRAAYVRPRKCKNLRLLTQITIAQDDWNRYSGDKRSASLASTSHSASVPVSANASPPVETEVTHPNKSRTVSASSAAGKRAKNAIKPANGPDDSDSDLEEGNDVFENPNALDRTSEDEESDDDPVDTPHNYYPEPTCPDSPSIAIVETFERDEKEHCRLASGRIVTRYEHYQLVNIGERNLLMRSLNLFHEPRRDPTPPPPPSLPSNFQMPPPRKNPPRAAAGRFA